MKTEQEYIKDISDIRMMMEKSTRFLSLAGMAGIMAGIYALVGAYVVYSLFDLDAITDFENNFASQGIPADVLNLIALAFVVLLMAIGTGIFLSYKKAKKNKEVLWNTTSRRLVLNMAIPLVAGGIFILILVSKGIPGLMMPLTLIFYGLALINASRFTFDELRYMGIMEILLGLLSTWFLNYSLLCWALGFGMLHIIYGIYMHWRYER